MSAQDVALDALTAIRDAGLATDRRTLNRAYAQLTGRLGALPDPSTRGPCTRCHETTIRYGERGHPLCRRCQRSNPKGQR